MNHKILNLDSLSKKEAEVASFFSYDSLYAPHFYRTHLKTNKELFEHPLGYLAYQYLNGVYVIAGEPVAACLEDSLDIMDAFMAEHENDVVCGYYFKEDFVKSSSDISFYQLGIEKDLNLGQFNGQGYEWRDYRRALKKAEEEELVFEELSNELDFEFIKNIETRWLKSKKLPPMGFLLSRSQLNSIETYFVVKKNNVIQAYVSIVNSTENSVYIDQMVQSPDGHKWALDFAFAELINHLKKKKKSYLHLGLCAFDKIHSGSLIERSLSQLRHISLYPSKSLSLFKGKYSNEEQPVYLLLDPKKNLLKQVKALYDVTFKKGESSLNS